MNNDKAMTNFLEKIKMILDKNQYKTKIALIKNPLKKHIKL